MKIMYVNLGTGVCGGVRIICEHLNRLTEKGHECYMGVMSGEPVLDWMPISFPIIPPHQLEAKAKDMDVLVATEANTAEPVARMQTTAKKFYFIQMRESLFFVNGDPIWAGTVEANYKRLKGVLSPVVISWWLKDFLEEIYGYEDVPIVPNGLNEKMFYPDPKYPKGHLPRVLIEGHTHGEAKDIRGIAKSIVDAYRKQVRPIEVWGFSQLEPTDNFNFDMFSLLPTQDEIRQIYSSCDVLVKASRFEGRSCVHVEAMACGTAVVCAIDKGDDDLIHGYNCLKVGYDVEHPQQFQQNVNKMFNHLVAVLTEDRLRQGLVTNGLYYVKHNLRWGAFIDRIETVFDGGTPPPLPRTEHVMEDEDEG